MNTPLTPPTFSLRHLLWSLLASLIFVPLAFWGVSLDDVWRIVQQADWRPVALAALLFVLTLAAKSARWQLFFQPRLSFLSLFAALTIGAAVNFFLPARLGEVARLYVLRRREGEAAARILGTIGAEKLIELVALFVLTLLVAPFVPFPAWLRDPSLRLSALVLGAVLLLSAIFMQQSRLRRLWTWLGAKVFRVESPRIENQFDLTLGGFAPLRQRTVLPIALWSFVIWAMMIATNWLLFFALAMPPSWLVATVLLIVLQIGVAVPTTPGKVGVVPALARLTLTLFGVNQQLAFSYGVILYLVVTVPQVVVAGPFVFQELMSLRRAPAKSVERA